MPFRKGDKKPPASGRKAGSANKSTKSAREAFALAFDGLGGYKGLQAWAANNETAFYQLYARLIPVEHVGDGGEGPVQTIVKHIFPDGKP
jgi:hypothetical protein